MYRLFFKPATPNTKKKRSYKKLIQKPYSAFEGKIIRHIYIETLDPFGYSIIDSIVITKKTLNKVGNKTHVKTKQNTIRNLLLIRENQVFDSLLVKESERLVRTRGYIRDVSFFVKTVSKSPGFVDIYIRELDKWSINPKGGISPSRISINLTEENFMGFGHEFENVFTRINSERSNSFYINYTIPNFRSSYVSTIFHYGIDGHKNFNRSISVERLFYSPFARWAGGVTISSLFNNVSLKDIHSVEIPFDLRFSTQDYWAGIAQKISKGNTETERATNLIFALRYLSVRYFGKPYSLDDPLHIYADEKFYLGSVGLSTRKYVMDKYIFNFGITEVIPVGKAFGLTVGYQEKNNTGRLYLGARVSLGNYYSWGYISSNMEYGTFIHASHTTQGVFTASVNYFTGLLEIRRWKFREFVKSQFTIGIKREPYESLDLNEGYGLNGFTSSGLTGTSRLLFTLQTQTYAPWNFIGFRFGPYLVFSLGMLGDAIKGFNNSKLYTQIGLGILIKNENLVISTFQISIAYYPSMPGAGQNVFKFNPYKTTDFGFRDFETGKPGPVLFQ